MRKIEALGKTEAKLKWVSFEPWLSNPKLPLQSGCPDLAETFIKNQIGWSVIGGESGSKDASRLMTLEDARYLFSSSQTAGCKVHFKQLGTKLAMELGVYSTAGKGEHRSKGGHPDQIPSDLRKKEWPKIARRKFEMCTGFEKAFDLCLHFKGA